MAKMNRKLFKSGDQILGSWNLRSFEARLDEMSRIPPSAVCMFAIQVRIICKVRKISKGGTASGGSILEDTHQQNSIVPGLVLLHLFQPLYTWPDLVCTQVANFHSRSR